MDGAIGLTRSPVPGRADRIALDDALVESTRRKLVGYLQAPDLTSRQEKLLPRTVRWLAGGP